MIPTFEQATTISVMNRITFKPFIIIFSICLFYSCDKDDSTTSYSTPPNKPASFDGEYRVIQASSANGNLLPLMPILTQEYIQCNEGNDSLKIRLDGIEEGDAYLVCNKSNKNYYAGSWNFTYDPDSPLFILETRSEEQIIFNQFVYDTKDGRCSQIKGTLKIKVGTADQIVDFILKRVD